MLRVLILKLIRQRLAKLAYRWMPVEDADQEISCGDGCYESDGTLVPLGDLGVLLRRYKLKP